MPGDAKLHVGWYPAECFMRLGKLHQQMVFIKLGEALIWSKTRLCYGVTPAWPIDAAPSAFSDAGLLLEQPSARRLSSILFRQPLYLA